MYRYILGSGLVAVVDRRLVVCGEVVVGAVIGTAVCRKIVVRGGVVIVGCDLVVVGGGVVVFVV